MLEPCFDFSKWVAAGRPGYSFEPWPDQRTASSVETFGSQLTADDVAAAIQVVPKSIRNWARRSVTLIESWRWASDSPAGRRAHRQALAKDVLRSRWGPVLSAIEEWEGQGDQLYARETLRRVWMDEPRWIRLPQCAPPRFSDHVLLRQIPATVGDGSPWTACPLVRDPGESSDGFVIVRHSLGQGRGRGWLFQRAKVPILGTGTLPTWLSSDSEGASLCILDRPFD